MRYRGLVRQFAAAAERNRGPILDILRSILPAAGTIVEIASGTGQHVAHFAQALPSLTWQPTDPQPAARRSIEAWTGDLPNVCAPLELDVLRAPWPVEQAEGLVCINMLHISPWETCAALFGGAATIVAGRGPVILYGPYRIGRRHTSPSNARFDESLQAQDPRWGVRDLDDVHAVAFRYGFRLEARIAMPANNMTLVFRRP